ncbi:MAG: SRPBCC family protein [Hyphomicrobiales bacterium]
MNDSELVYTLHIKSTPEKVWAAITTPEFTRQYWGHNNISDWNVGSKWQHVSTKDQAVNIEGEVLESDPPNRLVVSWFSPNNKDDVSRVTYEIEAIKGRVRLHVVHSQLTKNSKMEAGVSKGWPLVLSSLKSFLETGEGFDIWA